MKWLGSSEFKVGLLVSVVLALIGFMSIKVSEGGPGFQGEQEFVLDLDDAGGLIKNSAVKMAGIKIGVIKDIRLVEGRAQIILSVKKGLVMTDSTVVEIRSDGILGDKHIELVSGQASDPHLKSGDRIEKVINRGSLDQVMKDIGRIGESLAKLSDVLNNAAQKGDDSTPVGRIILNIEKLTEDLASVTSENKEQVSQIIDRIDSITESLDNFVDKENPDSLQRSFSKLSSSFDNASQAIRNIEEISAKINDGKGTLGKLVNDEQTIEGINEAVDNVNDFLGGAGELSTSIDYHTEFMTRGKFWKSYLNFKIQPGLDRYYEIGIISDPRGVVTTTENQITVNDGAATTTRDKKTKFNDLKFNAIFAKNFYNFTIRGGLIESSAGIGFDYYFFDKRLKFTTEFFDLADRQIRVFSKYDIFSGLYIITGAEDLLENRGPYNWFIGGGILIDNDDLKMFASKLSF